MMRPAVAAQGAPYWRPLRVIWVKERRVCLGSPRKRAIKEKAVPHGTAFLFSASATRASRIHQAFAAFLRSISTWATAVMDSGTW